MNENVKAKILLVGSDRYLLGKLQESLKQDGCEVQVVHYSDEALKESADWKPDLIFLQALVDSEGLDVLTVLAELKKNKAGAFAMMIVFTPKAQAIDTTKELRGFTYKITYEESRDLIESIRRFISTSFTPATHAASARKILVVDDSLLQRKLMAATIMEASPGFEILEAADGSEAIELLGRNHSQIKLVISDWNMPKLSGIQFVEAFSKVPKLHKIPLVMVTANHLDTEVQEAYRCYPKLAGYLQKPFTPEKFRKFVAPFLEA